MSLSTVSEQKVDQIFINNSLTKFIRYVMAIIWRQKILRCWLIFFLTNAQIKKLKWNAGLAESIFPGNRASLTVLFLWRYIFCYLSLAPSAPYSQYWWPAFSIIGSSFREKLWGALVVSLYISIMAFNNMFQQCRNKKLLQASKTDSTHYGHSTIQERAQIIFWSYSSHGIRMAILRNCIEVYWVKK